MPVFNKRDESGINYQYTEEQMEKELNDKRMQTLKGRFNALQAAISALQIKIGELGAGTILKSVIDF